MFTQLAYQADADECRAVCFLGRPLMMNARRSSADGNVCFLLSRPANTVNGILKSLYLGMKKIRAWEEIVLR